MTRSCFLILTLCCLLLSGCSKGSSDPQVKLPPLKIGAGVYTETIIIAEMAKLLAERNRGYATEIILSIPSSRVMHQGRINGEIDLSIAFTGTELSGPLAPSPAFHDRTAALQYMTEEFSRRFKQKVIGPLGFENTYAIAVRQDTAVAQNLNDISDLLPYSRTYRLGSDTTWHERGADGYAAFTSLYDLNFLEIAPMEIGLVYKALADKRLDASLVYSTDPRLKTFQLRILRDDRHFFPPYDAVLVIRNEAAELYPGLVEELEKLNHLIANETIIELNYQVDALNRSPEQVAEEFLNKHQLLKY